MKLLQIVGAIVKPFAWVFKATVKSVKWVYKKLPGLRYGIAKWLQTTFVYVAFGAIALLLSLVMLPLLVRIVAVAAVALLLSLLTVVRVRVTVSEQEIKELQREFEDTKIQFEDEKQKLTEQVEKQEMEIAKLNTDVRNQGSKLLDMSWIWEINLAKIKSRHVKVFDYFIRDKEEPILWEQRPAEKLELGDKRVLGALKIDYESRIGIDLKQVLISFDRQTNVIKYALPKLSQTGVTDPEYDWQIKTEMEYMRSQGSLWGKSWRLSGDKDSKTQLIIWEKEKDDSNRKVFASKELEEQVIDTIKDDMKRRLSMFFQMILRYDAIEASRDELQKGRAITLGEALPSLLRDEVPQSLLPEQQSDKGNT